LNGYKFREGDLVVTSKYHAHPGHHGILMERIHRHGTWSWRIRWLTDIPYPYRHTHKQFRGMARDNREGTECEINLYNLRRRYHYYNKEGEYYESRN
jgi:hypothetical protein